LRRRGVRGEQPLELTVGMLPPRPEEDPRLDPEAEALLADSVGLALYVVMDFLTPAERVSFVLHDVFEIPFDAIGAILGRSTAATKMLASRARGRIRLGHSGGRRRRGGPRGRRRVPRGGWPGRPRRATGRARPRGRTTGPKPRGGSHHPRRCPGRGPGQDRHAGRRNGPSGACQWLARRPHHRKRTTGHHHGVHGRRRRYHSYPCRGRPRPAGPDRPLMGHRPRVTAAAAGSPGHS